MGNSSTRNHAIELMDEGNAAFRSERFRDAISFHLQALQFMEPGSVEQAECFDHLGQEFWRVGDIHEALQYSKRALAIKEEKLPRTSSLAKTLSNIGCIFHERGEYQKAYFLLEGALAIRKKLNPGSLEVSVTCTNLGLVLMQLGRYQEAVDKHQQARAIKEALAPNSVTLARTYVNLGNVCASAGNYEKSMAFLGLAKQIAVQQKPVPISLISTIEMNMGNALFGAGAYKRAAVCYEKAITKERAVAPDSLILAEMYTEIAKAYDELGEQDGARAARSRAIQIRCIKAPTYLDQGVRKVQAV